ncbi:hypothetical protein AHF37_11741 [Paragonimus kellicotti]|nr:hypothetical protein AHF37_11741 [Paragonimus kellicotti]
MMFLHNAKYTTHYLSVVLFVSSNNSYERSCIPIDLLETRSNRRTTVSVKYVSITCNSNENELKRNGIRFRIQPKKNFKLHCVEITKACNKTSIPQWKTEIAAINETE